MRQPSPSETDPVPFRSWREGFWRRTIAISDAAGKRLNMVGTFALIAVIGAADFLTGFELSMQVFYLIPVCFAVASVGWRFGTVTAVLSVMTEVASDFLAGARFRGPFVPVWNGLIVVSTYMVVIWLLASVIAARRGLEERVRQRTADLTDEIADRVRLEKAVLEITERERRAIGHDLHDGLSQHLTGTALVAQALAAKVAPRSAEESAEVARIVGLIEQGIEQTRMLAKGLLLAEIEKDGLVDALQELAIKVRSQFRVQCDLSCAEAPAVGESGTATHIYRIAEEATRNALRHGSARRVSLSLGSDQGALVLEVRDDGSGILPKAERGQGLGMRIMAHRSAIIGAKFSVEALPGGGTSVVCRLPHDRARP
jgi:signal transduction histidine kinase